MHGPLTLKNRMLSTPLLNISKASTPVRTRIISNNAPLNSTPISQLKCGITSPGYNKENNNNLNLNETNLLQSRKQRQKNKQNQRFSNFSKTMNFGDFRNPKNSQDQNKSNTNLRQSGYSTNLRQSGMANLSPIMALNRKMNEGPSSRIQNCFRSFTPGYVKRADSPLQISRNKLNDSSLKSNSIIIEQKTPLAPSNLNTSNLRKSNSFANLFEKRSNTPTRLGSMAFNSLSKKNSNGTLQSSSAMNAGNLKQSLSFNNQQKFMSGNFDKKIMGQPVQTSSKHIINNLSPNLNQNNSGQRLMCNNNHNKLAKYRIITNDKNQDQEIEDLVYCSKCAIDLVQKGFSVEEINNLTSNQVLSLGNSPKQNQFSSLRQSNSFQNKFLHFKTSNNPQTIEKIKMADKIKNRLIQHISKVREHQVLFQRKSSTDLQQLNCYYDSLISYIQQQRSKDRMKFQGLKQNIIKELLDGQGSFQNYDEKLKNSLNKIEHFLKTKNVNTLVQRQLKQIQQSLNLKQNHLMNINSEILNILQNENHKIVYFDASIQQQFDEFVSYLDNSGKLKFHGFNQNIKPYMMNHNSTINVQHLYKNQSSQHNNNMVIGKNNALRFSFQKALQNQNKKKSFLVTQMNPLLQQQNQEQQDYEHDENSFNLENNNMMAASDQNLMNQNGNEYLNEHEENNYYGEEGNIGEYDMGQKPFRTLFADEDDILQDDQFQQSYEGKNNDIFKGNAIPSPMFKAI